MVTPAGATKVTKVGCCHLSALGTALALLASGCGSDTRPQTHAGQGAARVGVQPALKVHLYENHSSALIAWRRQGVHDRILVHVDAHPDLDWLPDETVARIAASQPDELADLELHPYAMDGDTLSRFGTSNYVYPAARLGIVREMVWVVPDGTLEDPRAIARLGAEILVGGLQMVSEEDVRTFRVEGKRFRGNLLGLPVTICALDDLPEIREPVLLDIDLDYFTTRSALVQQVDEIPWTLPGTVLESLARQDLRSDVVTLSLSTMGGYLSPACRWLGPALQEALRSPRHPDAGVERLEGARAEAAGQDERALELYWHLLDERGEDASLWYALAGVFARLGRAIEATSARERAVALDPLLVYADLFEGDRLWLNGRYEEALARFGRYLSGFPGDRFTPYALRRRAGCLMRLNRHREAIETFREVLLLAPQHADTHMDLGMLLRERGDLDQAAEEFRRARNVLPDVALYRMALGTTYLMGGRVEEAIEELEAAVERRPCFLAARSLLASALFQLGRYQESGRHLAFALALEPSSPQLRLLAAQLRKHGVSLEEIAAMRP